MVKQATATLDPVFRALAHPARRRIVHRLAFGPASVGEVAAPLEMSAPAVSKHLKVLESAGMVTRRIVGRNHHISLVRSSLETAGGWISEVEGFWNGSLDMLRDQIEGGAE